MDIYAKGKYIPTQAFCHLFRRGEQAADTINIRVDRVYDGNDLSDCVFLMRGINENGEEAQQILTPEPGGSLLNLIWKVARAFTAVAGRLDLELRVSSGGGDGDEDIVLKYEMPPVFVSPSPEGKNIPLPDTAQQYLGQLLEAAKDALDSINDAYDKASLDSITKRLDSLELAVDALRRRTEVIPVTESEYASMTPAKDVVYIIVKE